MLTRLEVNGFKNLLGVSVDFGPFTCLAGPNAVGKSNIFDAIRFLSLLADGTLMEAALRIRGSEMSDLTDLFWTNGSERADSFTLAAEMIVDETISDDFGRPATATSSFLRYELELGHEPPGIGGTLGRLVLRKEQLNYITEKDAASRLRFPHSVANFRKHAVVNRRRSPAGYISTEVPRGAQPEILVHQDGGSSGKPQRAAAMTAPRTALSTSNTSATPTILAARREMQRWRILSLEPTSMRAADKFHSDPHITANGDHLGATLYRLGRQADDTNGSRSAVYARVAARLSKLVAVTDLEVIRDDVRQLLTLEVTERSGTKIPARSLSDGTLRFLTLSILSEDPDARGLLCMEEPENGIHPARIEAMVDLLHALAIDPESPPSRDNPMRQIILATHSPIVVQLLQPDELVCATETSVRGPTGAATTTLRLRPMLNTWRSDADNSGVGLGTILAYLTSPPGAQIRISDIHTDLGATRQE